MPPRPQILSARPIRRVGRPCSRFVPRRRPPRSFGARRLCPRRRAASRLTLYSSAIVTRWLSPRGGRWVSGRWRRGRGASIRRAGREGLPYSLLPSQLCGRWVPASQLHDPAGSGGGSGGPAGRGWQPVRLARSKGTQTRAPTESHARSRAHPGTTFPLRKIGRALRRTRAGCGGCASRRVRTHQASAHAGQRMYRRSLVPEVRRCGSRGRGGGVRGRLCLGGAEARARPLPLDRPAGGRLRGPRGVFCLWIRPSCTGRSFCGGHDGALHPGARPCY